MGNCQSTIHNEEQRFLQKPQQGKASEFYWACQNGEVEKVKELLKNIPYQDLNRLEPNGSTPLHAASSAGQAEIVHLLLDERGCRRDGLNSQGLTAYEKAPSDEIRKLFHRPGGVNRFCVETDDEQDAGDSFEVDLEDEAKEGVSDDEFYEGDDWVEVKPSDRIEISKRSIGTRTALYKSRIGQKAGKATAGLQQAMLEEFLDQYVTSQHPEYEKCKSLVKKAFTEDRPEHLLRLYTLETPFYHAIVSIGRSMWLESALLKTLYKLEPRYFEGMSYRGVKMTAEDLRTYKWAIKRKGAIRTRTFSSTSLDRSVAERFAGTSTSTDEKQSVLMIFNFSNKCDTAVNLGKLSNKHPCISEYENEAEVLILPNSYFMITQMKKDSSCTTICLENIIPGGFLF